MVATRAEILTGLYSPAVVGTSECAALFPVKTGTRVYWVMVKPVVNAAGSTSSLISIGDDSDLCGWLEIANYDLETATLGTLIDGAGAYRTTGKEQSGKLYTADDTIDANYTAASATGAIPKFRWYAKIERLNG